MVSHFLGDSTITNFMSGENIGIFEAVSKTIEGPYIYINKVIIYKVRKIFYPPIIGPMRLRTSFVF